MGTGHLMADTGGMDGSRLRAAMDRLSQSLTPGDLDHTLQRITEAALEVLPGVQYANITVRHQDGRLETVAQTDDLLLAVDGAQFQLQEGPCYDAATDEAYVTSPNLAADERYPRYGPVAVRAGIRAQAGIRLFETPRQAARGALNLYSRQVGTFADMSMLAALFSHQAALAIEYARHAENLRVALETRRTIGMAVGIVMERYQLDEQGAFGFLTRLSQTSNVKLREVAAAIIADAESSRS